MNIEQPYYRKEDEKSQNGEIGIVLAANWVVPLSKSAHHREAAQRALDFTIGWFMPPLTRGDYPHSMCSVVMNRLPKFTRKESKMVKGSFDFIRLNYYSASYATNDIVSSNSSRLRYLTDWHVTLLSEKNGVRIGPQKWERPKPGRRPDIFPQFSPMKTPLPTPMPADLPEEDEDEEEKKEEEEEDPEKEEQDNPEKQ